MALAVVVDEPGAPPSVRDISLAPVGRHEVRVRIAAAGVCHSDLSMVNGTLAPAFPLVLGHEASGTIAAVGDGVDDMAPGDRVVLNWAPPCRTCWFCLQGQPWLCSKIEGLVSTPMGLLPDGEDLNACMGVGAFAEEVVLPRRSVVALPDGVPLDLAALLGCAVLTGVGAVRNTAGLRVGESALVLGLGGIGLCAVAGARLSGASQIIAADIVAAKEPLAMQLGATHFVTSGPDLAKQVRKLTGGQGVDHSFECIGTAATTRLAWQSARRGGQCTLVGVGRRSDELTLNVLELFHFARNLTSSVYGSSDPDRDIPLLAALVGQGRLDLKSLVSHRIGIGDVDEAFARMLNGEGARSLIMMDA